MRAIDYVTKILPKIPFYALARWGGPLWVNPLTLTFSVTSACQSRCLTCHIGQRFADNPQIVANDLTLTEIETIFAHLGEVYFLNISGGEPFMRSDLPQIIELACRYLRPRLIHIPTNALLPRRCADMTEAILAIMDRELSSHAVLTIKPSVDGVGEEHDRLRGVAGNFVALEETLERLLILQKVYPRLHVDVGTVISVYNQDRLVGLSEWVHARGIGSYRHEIAEERFEFLNRGEGIAPLVEDYIYLIRQFQADIVANIGTKSSVTRMTEAVRLVYYDVALAILQTRRQVISCYAGLSNIHLNYDGEVWPCCVLGGDRSFGNVRREGIHVLLRGSQAKNVRRFIVQGGCVCPLANQWLNNVLLTPRWMLKVVRRWLVLIFKN
ncbi:MAG: radical SAM protein [Magnetococcus sp. DMHC-6]